MKKTKEKPILSPIQPDFVATKEHREKKIKIAINLLNEIVKIKIAPSPIHGVGIFAMRNMKKGEKLNADADPHIFDVPYEDFKKFKPEISEMILGHWPQIVNGSLFYYPVAKMVAYMNHSDKPNYDGKKDVLTKAVKKGQEITENYRDIEGFDKIFPWLASDHKK